MHRLRLLRTRRATQLVAAVALVAGVSSALAQEVSGEKLFRQQCATCHAVVENEPHRQGSTLWGVVGRKAGAFADFDYSPAFRKSMSGKVLTEALIDAWITDPQVLAPGAVMAYQQHDAEKRKIIIDYLKTLK